LYAIGAKEFQGRYIELLEMDPSSAKGDLVERALDSCVLEEGILGCDCCPTTP
jgi:hypothetical protein